MGEFIFDLITARGWSIRHLGELTGISYSGIRDYLRGMPQRLSKARLSRVHELLDLDEQGRLKPHTLYTWRVEVQEERLSALNRVLLTTIEQYSAPKAADTSDVSSTPDTSGAPAAPEATGSRHQFTATPLFGGDTEGLPAPYWVLCWQDIYLLIHWQLPATRRVKKIPGFYAQQDSHLHDLPIVNPNIQSISAVCWAPGMELSSEKARGIHLTPAQISQLKKSESTTTPLKLETLKGWLQAEPFEDPFWAAMHSEPDEPTEEASITKDIFDEEDPFDAFESQHEPAPWTWEIVLEKLKRHYKRPEIAAKALGLK